MKRTNYLLVAFLLLNTLFISCNKEELPGQVTIPDTEELDFSQLQVQDFTWQGLNIYYLWKDDVPKLHDSKIEDDKEYHDLLSSHQDPFDFFESLLYRPDDTDVYSWIVDDYVQLQNGQSGIIKSHGVKYRLSLETGSDVDVLGFVRYVLPNSDADGKDVQRGYVFDAIDGVQLTTSNYQELLGQDSYTMNFADLNEGNPISNGKSIELTKQENLAENPVHIVKTLDISGVKIGYVMLNAFDAGYEKTLNDAFAQLKSEGVAELVLDLRYNLGGFGYIAEQLASMITGQFTGEVAIEEQWNSFFQAYWEKNNPEYLVSRFPDKVSNLIEGGPEEPVNSLNLNKVYILTTYDTASASEFLISALDPYINVVTIGTTTRGKYTGSRTIYDSKSFSFEDDSLNKNHKWAMQPIVLKYTNILGESVQGGIEPDIEEIEYVSEFAELGNPEEPLLAKAIEQITGVVSKNTRKNENLTRLEQLPLNNSLEATLLIIKELPIIK